MAATLKLVGMDLIVGQIFSNTSNATNPYYLSTRQYQFGTLDF